MALYLMWVMLPLLISTSTSSSSSRGVRKALVGMASVYLLYLPCQFLHVSSVSGNKVQATFPTLRTWKEKKSFTLFSDYNRSLLRRQPGAMTIGHSPKGPADLLDGDH